jgi:HK97 family phage prohead protease
MTRALMSRADKMPYGDVQYADDGMQPDGMKRYPLDSEAHIRAAWTYVHQRENAEKYTPEQLKKVMSRIRAAMQSIGAEVEDDDTARSKSGGVSRLPNRAMPSQAGPSHAKPGPASPYPDRSSVSASRSRLWAPPPTYDRTFRVMDIEISRARGDGREVEAYCAVFDQDAEIHDHQGHYLERIDSKAFNRQIGLGIDHVGVFYHHGMTIHGTPSDVYSVPIGRPLEIRPDGKGLRTVARYNDGPDADRILEAIRNGAIRGYSFRGPIYGSNPDRPARRKPGGPLPMVVRTALGLTEFGPTPTPAYESAGILAVRSATAFLENLSEDDRDLFKAEIIRILSPSTRIDEEPDDPDVDVEEDDLEGPDGDLEDDSETDDDQEDDDATSDPEPGTDEDQPAERARHSDRIELNRALLRMELTRRGERRG